MYWFVGGNEVIFMIFFYFVRVVQFLRGSKIGLFLTILAIFEANFIDMRGSHSLTFLFLLPVAVSAVLESIEGGVG